MADAEQDQFIKEMVDSGAYASVSDVVRAGLLALQERDAAVARWLHENVVPVYDATCADPSRVVPVEQVFSGIRARHTQRLKDTA